MSVVCGVDVGSLRTLAYVAWVKDRMILLDAYVPNARRPLPAVPVGWDVPNYVAFDAPQGLPAPGAIRRLADKEANTPTRKLPTGRSQLAEWRLYKGLVEAGVEIFWSIHQSSLGSVLGLASGLERPVVLETYPRYVVTRRWPGLRIPSKRKAPLGYVQVLWDLLRNEGYECRSVARPSVDQLDAVLCAVAAEACLAGGGMPAGTVGLKPILDPEERVLREGFIVSP